MFGMPLTLILSPLRAGRGELERTRPGALFGDRDTQCHRRFPSPFLYVFTVLFAVTEGGRGPTGVARSGR